MRRVTRGIDRGEAFSLVVDDRPVMAFAGESLAAALLAAGFRAFGRRPSGEARGLYCNMGVCHDCWVEIIESPDARAGVVRACLTGARPGMVLWTGLERDG